MKKVILLSFLLSVAQFFAQNKIAQEIQSLQVSGTKFKSISILNPNSSISSIEVDKVVEGATLAKIDLNKINDIVANKYQNIELEIPYQNQIVKILLYRVNPFAEGFHIDTDKAKNITYQQGVYYRGIINGETNSVSSFNFFNGECNGIFSNNEFGNVVVGKLKKANNVEDYIVYSDAKMKVSNNFDCSTKDVVNVIPTNTNRNIDTDRCVTMYFEIDYNIFLENGGNETTTTNWMTSVFNNIQTLYNNDGITTAIKSIYIWTDFDPYEGIGTSSFDYLMAFNQTRPIFDGDLGQLVGIDDGGLGGVAITIDGLCTRNNFSYSDVNINYQTVPTYSWTINVITHEFGHLLGSPHTHGCYWNGNNTAIDGCGRQAGFQEGNCPIGPIPSPTEKGTMMSYCHLISGVGIGFNNGFGPQPAQRIIDAINGSGCLSFDCINTCINTISAITTSEVTETSLQIDWEDVSNSSWQVSVTPFNSTNINWITVTANSYNATGLSPNTFYKVRVRPFCEGLEATAYDAIILTAGQYCSNMPFTDTGGTTAEYTDMETWTRTMTPYNPGLKIRVTFTAFNLETDYDYLYIYNGPDEFGIDLTNGGLTGTTLPSPASYTSTSSEGSLTFKFTSDQAVTAPGWNARITCTGTLDTHNNDYLDFSYYPNPSKGIVNMVSNAPITEVEIYNIEGRLLSIEKKNDLNTIIDISQFATGTYFFKVKFGDIEKNFKVMKY